MCIEDMDLEDMAKVIISEADQKKILADEDFCKRLMTNQGTVLCLILNSLKRL